MMCSTKLNFEVAYFKGCTYPFKLRAVAEPGQERKLTYEPQRAVFCIQENKPQILNLQMTGLQSCFLKGPVVRIILRALNRAQINSHSREIYVVSARDKNTRVRV